MRCASRREQNQLKTWYSCLSPLTLTPCTAQHFRSQRWGQQPGQEECMLQDFLSFFFFPRRENSLLCSSSWFFTLSGRWWCCFWKFKKNDTNSKLGVLNYGGSGAKRIRSSHGRRHRAERLYSPLIINAPSKRAWTAELNQQRGEQTGRRRWNLFVAYTDKKKRALVVKATKRVVENNLRSRRRLKRREACMMKSAISVDEDMSGPTGPCAAWFSPLLCAHVHIYTHTWLIRPV